MLLKIREKSQGTFAWVILIMICVPFMLWGIQNYMGGGSENAVASVGDKEFFQNDVNQAYAQYSQNLAGMNFDEATVKQQALNKLIKDEVLFQHVQAIGLVVTDNTAKQFIHSLEYFQTDGQFDKDKYHSLLGAQRLSSTEFVARIKKALVMEQFQQSITDSSFATETELENFFKIQNQQRDVEMIAIALPEVTEQPTTEAINTYYQQNQNKYLTSEKVAIEYVELSLNDLALQIESTEEQLQAYYQTQKDFYTTKERRKISHILFAFTKDTSSDEKQLEKALNAKQQLATQSFEALAKVLSDDKITASKGGDLGLFNVGVMEESFEQAASALQLNEVSSPVKSAFGYHLIKVTELTQGTIKSFEDVKAELTLAYQKSEAENKFYALGESLSEISYENPDSLQGVADELGLKINTTPLFAKGSIAEKQLALFAEPKIVDAAFSEDVLKGNNSESIEIGTDNLVVLRMTEYKPAEAKPLEHVEPIIKAILLNLEAKKLALESADKIKAEIVAGKSSTEVADEHGLPIKTMSNIERMTKDIPWNITQAIFKAAKPLNDKTTVFTVTDTSGTQTVIKLLKVTEGMMTKSDRDKKQLASQNIAKALGQSDFEATLQSLENNMNVIMYTKEE